METVSSFGPVSPQIRLEGEHLLLRIWEESDEPALVDGLNNSEIERFMAAIPFPYTAAHARSFVAGLAPAAWTGGGAMFAIDEGDGLAVGGLGIERFEHPDGPVGRVGYWVAHNARGRKLASRALRLSAPWAMDSLGLRRQELVHDLDNFASCRTAVAGGFRIDAVLRGGGQHRDGSPRDVERHILSPK